MNRLYYISFVSDEDYYGNFNHTIKLQKLENEVFAYILIEKHFNNEFSRNWLRNDDVQFPILITNDARFYLKYRNVFSEEEFYAYSVAKFKEPVEINKLSYLDKYRAKSSPLLEEYSNDLFEHFKNIITGIYNYAASEIEKDEYTDEETGYIYSMNTGYKWWTSMVDFGSDIIEARDSKMLDKLHSIRKFESLISDEKFNWWFSLPGIWKKIFSNCIKLGIVNGIPTAEALKQILELKEIDLSWHFFSSHLEHTGIICPPNNSSNNSGPVIDIEPLGELRDLERIICSNNCISDLSPLRNLTKLSTLDCHANKITKLNPIQELYELTELDCSSNKIEDLRHIEKLTKLKVLNIGCNKVSNIAPLEYLINLENLNLDNNQINNIDPLNNLKNIKTLSIKNNPIRN